jgi:pimeloyl-ACP methyl ester carboxylesterase
MVPLIIVIVITLLLAPIGLVWWRERLTPQDLGAATGGTYISQDGYAIWYADEGPPERIPVVLVHGFAGWSFCWRAQRAALRAAGHRIITIDLLGCGASARAATPLYSTEAHAGFVVAVLDACRATHVILIGHSFGGRVAMQIALLHPERVVALAAIAPEAYATERPAIARWVGAPLVGFALTFYATMPRLVRTGLNFSVQRKECLTEEVVAGYAQPLFVRGSVVSQVWQARSPKDGARPVPLELGAIRCPTLLIWGEHDPIIPAEHGRRLVATLPDAQLQIIPAVGHLPYEEDPEMTNLALLRFLEERRV